MKHFQGTGQSADGWNKICKNKGFTLVELIIVLAIISILALITVPAINGYVERAKEEVCKANCLQLERMYCAYLVSEGLEHSDAVFENFIQEWGKDICPCSGRITFVDEKVKCSVHPREDKNHDDREVSFL